MTDLFLAAVQVQGLTPDRRFTLPASTYRATNYGNNCMIQEARIISRASSKQRTADSSSAAEVWSDDSMIMWRSNLRQRMMTKTVCRTIWINARPQLKATRSTATGVALSNGAH